jgi:P27 family predicted phage terminase small subunit
MPTKKQTETKRPTPPPEIEGEALLEWDRCCEELEQLGRLNTVDRGILTVHCQIYAANQAAFKHVAQWGPVLKAANGVVGQGPFWKTMKDATALLQKSYAELGLTPKARGFDANQRDDEGDDLDF